MDDDGPPGELAEVELATGGEHGEGAAREAEGRGAHVVFVGVAEVAGGMQFAGYGTPCALVRSRAVKYVAKCGVRAAGACLGRSGQAN